MFEPGGWVLEGATEDPDFGGLRSGVCWDAELGETGTRGKSGGTGPTLDFKLNLKVCVKHWCPP